MVNLILQVRDWLVHRHEPPPLTRTAMRTNRPARTHTASQRHDQCDAHILTRRQKHTRAHIPHGVGNMSEQSIIWHLNQSLLLEV